ncbi:2,4-dienoyl-CoA reductase [Zopfochytrium polystomum]|nr:2,4-dienoyl-CoA reductase [Zopfochytrium polystomum]
MPKTDPRLTQYATQAATSDVFLPTLFKGKVAFVTGGGSGICRGMAEAIARHGGNVAVAGRSLDKLVDTAAEIKRKFGTECLPVQTDVRSFEQVTEAMKKTYDKFGRIDFVVCGAAGNFLAPVEALSPNAFKTVVEIDLVGTFHTCKAALPYLKETRGSIINVTATLQYAGTQLMAHACAAKAGVDALTRVLAQEWGQYGIRVNGIAPGPIADTMGFAKLMVDDMQERALRAVPVKSFGTIRDIEHSTVFLFSESGRFVTGHILVVDGGQWMTGNSLDGVDEEDLKKKKERYGKRDARL